jgi:cyclopropane fatty-acyl-phospholipid synthase-like methyltransferase
MTLTFPQQLSAAAHKTIPHANPLSASQMSRLVEIAVAHAPHNALEIGCGPGSFAIALAKDVPVAVTALDINEDFLARARTAAEAESLKGSVYFHNRDAATFSSELFDLVVCIGSSQAFGTPAQAVTYLSGLLRNDGLLIFADLIWSSTPPQEFLSFLGVPEDFYWSEREEMAPFVAAGLSLQDTLRASPESWRSYEEEVLAGRMTFAKTLPLEQAEQVRERASSWFTAFEQHGCSCLGFGAYIAQKPASNS